MTNAEKIIASIIGNIPSAGDHIEIPFIFTDGGTNPDGDFVNIYGCVYNVVSDSNPNDFEANIYFVKAIGSYEFKRIYREFDSAESFILSDEFDSYLRGEFFGMDGWSAVNMVNALSDFRVSRGKSALTESAKFADLHKQITDNGGYDSVIAARSGSIFDPMLGSY